MTIYDGTVTVDDDQVPVIIGFEDDGLRMSAGGAEIGEWSDGEYTIDHRGDGVYSITAENETLVFVPAQPGLFAARITGTIGPATPEDEPTEPEVAAAAPPVSEDAPPRPITVVGFYFLAAITGVLGLLALANLFLN